MSRRPGILYPKTGNDLKIANADETKAMSRNLLGVAGQKVKSKSMVKAFSDPKQFIKDRNKALEEASDKANRAYFEFYNALIDAGADISTATEKAVERLNYIFDSEMAAYDAMHPGVEGATGGMDTFNKVRKEASAEMIHVATAPDIVSKELLNRASAVMATPSRRPRGRPTKRNIK